MHLRPAAKTRQSPEAIEPGRVYATFTPALHAWVDGLVTYRLDTVARASAGISGVPLVARLEPRKLTPSLVNAQPVK
jgi:hypothetical protein